MSIEGILLALVLTTLTVALVALPLLRRGAVQAADTQVMDKQRERLLVYYERVLKNIHDLDEDYGLGKLAPDEYSRDRELWAQRGVQVLKALDDLRQGRALVQPVPQAADDAAVDRAIDDTIEAAIRAYRSSRQPNQSA
jgi:serine kinase of HPr protein (carbohydrate metabolism regulator)